MQNFIEVNGAAFYTQEGGPHNLSKVTARNDGIIFEGEGAQAQVRILREKAMEALFVACRLEEKGVATLRERESVCFTLDLARTLPFVSVYQHKEWWLRPAFGDVLREIPAASQLIIFEDSREYHCLLAVSGKENRADLAGGEEGILLTLSANISGQKEMEDLALVYGHGQDPYALTEEMAGFALRLTGKRLTLRREKKFPEIFEKLGWCTWDSLGVHVNEEAIITKMREFQEKKLPVPWVLIDDGWSLIDANKRTLKSLDADLEKFPQGIAGTVRKLKEDYGVEYVGVWQATQGYWNGIEEGSEAERDLAAYLIRYPHGALTIKPEPEAAFGFWNTWHSRLRQAGVDFIKVDNQSSFGGIARGSCSYGQLARAIHTGLEASAEMNFNGNLINCMGMAPEDIWNRQSAALSRNSDDYTPTVAGSIVEHILQNCYNSVYHGCFYWGDWDMVWSCHEDVEQSMLLRALSGGPLYLSDGAGNTDPDRVWPLILEDGSILRCQDVGRPTLDCLVKGGEKGKGLVKVFNRYLDVVYVAALPVKGQEEELEGSLQASDFPIELTEKYWVYDWKKREARLCDAKTTYFFTVARKEGALFALLPCKEEPAILGITDKYLCSACVERIERQEEGVFVWCKTAGNFAFLTEKKVKAVKQDGQEFPYTNNGGLYTVAYVEKGHMLQIVLDK